MKLKSTHTKKERHNILNVNHYDANTSVHMAEFTRPLGCSAIRRRFELAHLLCSTHSLYAYVHQQSIQKKSVERRQNKKVHISGSGHWNRHTRNNKGSDTLKSSQYQSISVYQTGIMHFLRAHKNRHWAYNYQQYDYWAYEEHRTWYVMKTSVFASWCVFWWIQRPKHKNVFSHVCVHVFF